MFFSIYTVRRDIRSYHPPSEEHRTIFHFCFVSSRKPLLPRYDVGLRGRLQPPLRLKDLLETSSFVASTIHLSTCVAILFLCQAHHRRFPRTWLIAANLEPSAALPPLVISCVFSREEIFAALWYFCPTSLPYQNV